MDTSLVVAGSVALAGALLAAVFRPARVSRPPLEHPVEVKAESVV